MAQMGHLQGQKCDQWDNLLVCLRETVAGLLHISNILCLGKKNSYTHPSSYQAVVLPSLFGSCYVSVFLCVF